MPTKGHRRSSDNNSNNNDVNSTNNSKGHNSIQDPIIISINKQRTSAINIRNSKQAGK